MIEKDYIIRLINQFFEDLNLFIRRKRVENRQKELISLFNTYIGDYSFYHSSGTEDILKSFDIYSSDERIYRIQILAELYFQEAQLVQELNERISLLKKSLILFEYIDAKSAIYSIDRKQKIDMINGKLQNIIKENSPDD